MKAALLVTVLALTLAACGNHQPTAPQPTTPAASSATTGTPAATPDARTCCPIEDQYGPWFTYWNGNNWLCKRVKVPPAGSGAYYVVLVSPSCDGPGPLR